MTDRELLELAAKAAGIDLAFSAVTDISPRRTDNWLTWNPLSDDGTALQLAVKLKIDIVHWDYSVQSGTLGLASETSVEMTMGYSREEATRRAIVIAAAEIGKAMP